VFTGRYASRCIPRLTPRGEPPFPAIEKAPLLIIAKDGTVVGRVTEHVIDRIIGGYKREGVPPWAILDALKDSVEIVKGKESHGRPFIKYIGKNPTVIVTIGTASIVPVWPKKTRN